MVKLLNIVSIVPILIQTIIPIAPNPKVTQIGTMELVKSILKYSYFTFVYNIVTRVWNGMNPTHRQSCYNMDAFQQFVKD